MNTDGRAAAATGSTRPHAPPALAGPGRLAPVTDHTGALPDPHPAAPALLAAAVRRNGRKPRR
ncbi:hypothetical protein AB0F77_19435 [Streptomyces sp. NPDC026672]|uniref:hypothetical protein n=1 Tax=unclassified Streptomyces TaxID=2593676 RepID=UPI0033EE8912